VTIASDRSEIKSDRTQSCAPCAGRKTLSQILLMTLTNGNGRGKLTSGRESWRLTTWGDRILSAPRTTTATRKTEKKWY